MIKKLLIGTLIVLVIVAAILRAMFIPTILGVALIGVWIYLVYMVRKKKANLFHDQVEPEIAERRLKKLKAFLLVAGISLAVGIVGVVVHNAIYGLSGVEEPVFFVIALVGLWAFLVATIGGLVIFFKGRRKTT